MKKNNLKLIIEKNNFFLRDGNISIHFGRSLESFLRFITAGLVGVEENQKDNKFLGMGYDFIEGDPNGGEIHFMYDFDKKQHKILYKAIFNSVKNAIKLQVLDYSFKGSMKDVLEWYEDLLGVVFAYAQKEYKGHSIEDKKARKLVYEYVLTLLKQVNELMNKYSEL